MEVLQAVRATAAHEAAHAIFGIMMGRRFEFIEVNPDGEHGIGFVRWRSSEDTHHFEVYDVLRSIAAGYGAERYYQDELYKGDRADLEGSLCDIKELGDELERLGRACHDPQELVEKFEEWSDSVVRSLREEWGIREAHHALWQSLLKMYQDGNTRMSEGDALWVVSRFFLNTDWSEE